MNLYGTSYGPLGDLADFVDPFGLRKIPGHLKADVDQYVEGKAQRAATLAEQHVEAGVTRAVDHAGKQAVAFVLGSLVVGAIAGGIYFYRRSSAEDR